MIIQLHGAGERGGGEDLEKAEIHGLANILTETREDDLSVGQGRAAVRTPVDDAVSFVDQALFIQLAERLAHSL